MPLCLEQQQKEAIVPRTLRDLFSLHYVSAKAIFVVALVLTIPIFKSNVLPTHFQLNMLLKFLNKSEVQRKSLK